MRTGAAPVSRRALRAVRSSREMRKLIAAGMVLVALLAGGCSYGSVGTDNLTKATTGVLAAPLTLGTDFSAGLGQEALVGNTILEIKPLHPLLPSTCLSGGMFLGPNCATGTGYLVFLMNGITDASGNPA